MYTSCLDLPTSTTWSLLINSFIVQCNYWDYPVDTVCSHIADNSEFLVCINGWCLHVAICRLAILRLHAVYTLAEPELILVLVVSWLGLGLISFHGEIKPQKPPRSHHWHIWVLVECVNWQKWLISTWEPLVTPQTLTFWGLWAHCHSYMYQLYILV